MRKETPADMPDITLHPNYDIAVSAVSLVQQDISNTLGVLLTLSEIALAGSPALDSYKDSVRREIAIMRYRIQDGIYYKLGVQDSYNNSTVYLAKD